MQKGDVTCFSPLRLSYKFSPATFMCTASMCTASMCSSIYVHQHLCAPHPCAQHPCAPGSMCPSFSGREILRGIFRNRVRPPASVSTQALKYCFLAFSQQVQRNKNKINWETFELWAPVERYIHLQGGLQIFRVNFTAISTALSDLCSLLNVCDCHTKEKY